MPRVLDRRSVLKCLAAVAASTAFGCSDDDDDSPIVEDRAFYPQSVASGDPRPTSVVLWTRIFDPGNPGGDLRLTLQIATDDGFSQRVLELKGVPVTPAHDHVLKVKVTGLLPRMTYFFRFLYEKNGRRVASPVGRTRTAPEAGTDTPVRFVVANCQDYNGRHYNTWQRLVQLDEDLDFVVFLGDYVYETTLEAALPGPARQVRFSEPDGALRLATSGGTVLAAASLSNYRDLYRTYRSDAFLQQAHERYPFIVTWDDHEFSDDAWDAHANYTDGRQDELQVERRRNAERAFFEFDVDQWDGYPQERARLLGELRGRTSDRTVVVSGDIHAAFASVELGVPALTAPAISSSSVKEEAGGQVEAAGFPPGSAVYRYVVTEQDATLREGNPGIAFVDTDSHGFTVVEVHAEEVRAAYHLIPSAEARTSYADQPEALAARFTRRDFTVRAGAISVG